MSIKIGVYKHYKGNLYKVIGVANHSETLEEFVVYQALYGDKKMWIRPKDMFEEDIEIEGKNQKRFAYANDHEII